MLNLNINSSWKDILSKEFNLPYFYEIKKTIESEINIWKIIYPPIENIFYAFDKTSLNDLRVVILWQDPYHNPNQAHWLSFSVQSGIKPPPSLKNIFKELKDDLLYEIPNDWNLERWSKEGVLLLNAILTVEKNKPSSHSKIGWENFTNNIISYISNNKENVVFILWWNFAKSKINLIDEKRHFIITSNHPSPFSAYRWFFWSKPFSKTNDYLKKHKIKPINWNLN